ncbi:DEAD/DEAH box helicase family protein [Mycoplasma sp. 005V]|uniref:DEAD/DEAH box helicase family protein n=1 Tax=Mycoplasma sp. 005V TaxID=3398776 RepID=UPI003A8B9080
MKLTVTQKNAVDQLVEIYTNKDIYKKEIVEFKAPTGSGKTFMMANVIDQINKFSLKNNRPIIFLIVTLSSSELPKQMESNLNEYRYFLPDLPGVIRKESPSSTKIKTDSDFSIKPESNKIYIFGASSFGEKRIYTERGIYNAFLKEIKDNGWDIVYIRDEAHYGGDAINKGKTSGKYIDIDSKDSEKILISDVANSNVKFELLTQKTADYIIKMTATPNGMHNQIVIEETELEKDNIKLLKNQLKLNEGIGEQEDLELIDDNVLLEIACKKFLDVKYAYSDSENEKALIGINPAMLIQIEDKYSNKQESFNNKIQNIKNILNKYNLSWVTYFSDDKSDSNLRGKIDLKSISDNLSPIDVIIFKIGPATGWNIPRACMLVQLRDVSSKNLNTQVIGRIKRNPNPEYKAIDEDEVEADKKSIRWNYYIYSNSIKPTENMRVNMKLRPNCDTNRFITGKIDKEIKKIILSKEYSEKVLELVSLTKVKSAYEDYKKEYEKYGFITPDQETITDFKGTSKRKISRELKNGIDLQIYNEEQFEINKNLINKRTLENIYENIFTNSGVSRQMFYFIFFKKYLSLLKEERQKQIKKVKAESNGHEYVLSISKTLPLNNDFMIKKESSNKLKIDSEERYKYAYYNPIKKYEHLHYFDSKTEHAVFQSFFEFIKNSSRLEQITIWTKNPVHDGLEFEYYDVDLNVTNSYPDMAIKYKNHYGENDITVEIKNATNDYDREKTQKILESYQQYIEETIKWNDLKLLIDNNPHLLINATLIICHYNYETGEKQFSGYSTNKQLSQALEKGQVSEFREIFEYLDM